jgi:hypothetical protein
MKLYIAFTADLMGAGKRRALLAGELEATKRARGGAAWPAEASAFPVGGALRLLHKRMLRSEG